MCDLTFVFLYQKLYFGRFEKLASTNLKTYKWCIQLIAHIKLSLLFFVVQEFNSSWLCVVLFFIWFLFSKPQIQSKPKMPFWWWLLLWQYENNCNHTQSRNNVLTYLCWFNNLASLHYHQNIIDCFVFAKHQIVCFEVYKFFLTNVWCQ